MQRLLFIPVFIMAIFYTSCEESESATGEELVDTFDLDTESVVEINYEDIDVIAEAGLESVDDSGRLAEDALLDCATVTHDEENKIITIDYGTEGCTGPYGRTRKGVIIVEYSQRRLIPGAYRQVTLENFYLDSAQIEGIRRIENVSESVEDDVAFEVQLTGGKVTFADGAVATREVDHLRTWLRANNPLNDEITVEGEASGIQKDGVAYEVEVIEPMVYKRSCRVSGVFIAVSGIKQFTVGDNVALVDYGDGTCDNEVTITINDNQSFTKVITYNR